MKTLGSFFAHAINRGTATPSEHELGPLPGYFTFWQVIYLQGRGATAICNNPVRYTARLDYT